VPLDRFYQHSLRLGGAAPAVQLDPLVLLQVFVVLEEVADALAPVRADLIDVVDMGVAGEHLRHRNGKDLLIAASLVAHLQHADRAAADDRARNQRQRQDHHYVRRIAITAQGIGHVTVVARVAHRCGQDAVDEDRTGLLVDLVLHRLGILGDLDDDVDFVRRVRAGGDVVQAHDCSKMKAPCEAPEKSAILPLALLRCSILGWSQTSGTPQLGRTHTLAYPYGTPAQPVFVMSLSLNSAVTTQAPVDPRLQGHGYWDNPAARDSTPSTCVSTADP